MKKIAGAFTLLALLGTSYASHASFTAIDDGKLVYDSDLKLTWLADGNQPLTSSYHTTGSMPWGDAVSWAADLNFEGNSDWRLPTIDELSHLFTGLGGSMRHDI